jgi:fibrillarin-like rRNA methylase
MIMNRRGKYNMYETKVKKCRSIMTEAEKKRIEIQKEIEEDFQKNRNEMICRWKMIKSITFGQDPQKMFNYLTQSINGKSFTDKEKKNLNKHLNDGLKNNLRPMWNFNTKMANTMINEDIVLMTLLP